MTADPFDTGAALRARGQVEIDPAGRLLVADVTERFDPLDPSSLLRAYLVAVRQLRRQRREPVIVLRRDDVAVLADVLGAPAAEVIERLGALMGATRAQRTAMVALFASGAVVLGLATAAVAAPEREVGATGSIPTPGSESTTTMVQTDEAAGTPVVVFVDHGPPTPANPPASTAPSPPVTTVVGSPSTPAPGDAPAPTGAPRPRPTPSDPSAPGPSNSEPEPAVPPPTVPPTVLPTAPPTLPSVPPALAAPPLPSVPVPPPTSVPEPEPEPEAEPEPDPEDDEDLGDDPTVSLDPPLVEEPPVPTSEPGEPADPPDSADPDDPGDPGQPTGPQPNAGNQPD